MKQFLVSVFLLLLSASDIYADGFALRDTIAISSKVSFKYDLLNYETFRFHPVNGLDIQESGTFFFNLDTTSVFSSALRIQYASLPHIFEPELSLCFNRNNRHVLSLTAGRELHDWKLSPDTEMRWIKNTFSALWAHKNFKALIDKMYFSASYIFKPSTSSLIKLSYDRYDISPLKNKSTFSFMRNGRAYNPNVPANDYLDSTRVLGSRSGVSSISMSGEVTLGTSDRSPLLNVNFRYINHVNVIHPQLSLSQTLSRSKFDMFHWRINGGVFFGKDIDALSFHEWYHFQTSKKFFPVRNEDTGIIGLVAQNPYALSTNKWHIDSSLHLFKPKLILLQIPFFNYLSMGESLALSNVYTAQSGKIYTEVGYELLNVLNAFHIGVFSSFNGKEYKETNIRMGIVPKSISHKNKH